MDRRQRQHRANRALTLLEGQLTDLSFFSRLSSLGFGGKGLVRLIISSRYFGAFRRGNALEGVAKPIYVIQPDVEGVWEQQLRGRTHTGFNLGRKGGTYLCTAKLNKTRTRLPSVGGVVRRRMKTE